ncbi:MAG: hypothetical protein ACJA1A_001438 [Saprospiraceae bacterium]|jgi:hypothetical protein|tara:strand:+ start:103 stop:210 length:108 start_codon:yes stop_codon:yes gene_type:complete
MKDKLDNQVTNVNNFIAKKGIEDKLLVLFNGISNT